MATNIAQVIPLAPRRARRDGFRVIREILGMTRAEFTAATQALHRADEANGAPGRLVELCAQSSALTFAADPSCLP